MFGPCRLFCTREHIKKPSEHNAGERRECLTILEKVEWVPGLLNALATDAKVSPPRTTQLAPARSLTHKVLTPLLPVCFRPALLVTSRI